MTDRMKRILCLSVLLIFASSCHTPQLAASGNKPVLKIMTYNIRHGAPIHKSNDDIQLKGIVEAINAQKPDLVALQEVDSMTERASVDEAKELATLTGMHYFFSKTINFQGGQYGDAILSRFQILSTQHVELPMPNSSGEARALGIVTVEPFHGVKINFAVTHLDLKKENRIAEINQIIQISKQSEHPFILAGDFNATPPSEEIKLLGSEFTFACSTNCPFTFPSDNPRVTIDYIVLNPAAVKIFSVESYKAILDIGASDHLPLMEYLLKK